MRTMASYLLPLCALLWLLAPSSKCQENAPAESQPHVTIVMLVRDKAHALPYTLGAIERLDYNASKLSLAFYVDHSADESHAILQLWLRASFARYRSVQLKVSEFPHDYPDESVRLDWTRERILNVLRLRQVGLDLARHLNSEFALFLDADALITHPGALKHLVGQNRSLLAPLLNCSTDPSHGSNFWGGIDSDGFYVRSPDYMDIRARRRLGIFPVSVLHTAFLLSLRPQTASFRFYPIPDDYPDHWHLDDLPVFFAAAKAAGIQPEVDNQLHFGVFSYVDRDLFSEYLHHSIDLEAGAFKHALLEYHYHWNGQAQLEVSSALAGFAFPLGGPRRMGFDRIFVINLVRRPDRLERMRYALRILGIEWNLVEAVDGRQLNLSQLRADGIEPLAGYADPYHGRGLTTGEVGCFLSHYAVWQEVLSAGYQRVLVLEDDVRFGYNFEERLALALEEADRLRPKWDLLYLGRKIMHREEEALVGGAAYLSVPSYTYWTLSYALSRSGAHKLVDQKPLGKMIAVDEYLPIMFDRHPNTVWKANFQPRNLLALSAAPLLVEPNYYIGMQHYVSDTEKSEVISKPKQSDLGVCEGTNAAEVAKCNAAATTDSTIRN